MSIKLYKYKPNNVVRIHIKGGKGNSKVLTVQDATVEETLAWVKNCLKDIEVDIHVKALGGAHKLMVCCYEAMGNKKGRSKSVTVHGLTAIQVYDHLMRNIEQ